MRRRIRIRLIIRGHSRYGRHVHVHALRSARRHLQLQRRASVRQISVYRVSALNLQVVSRTIYGRDRRRAVYASLLRYGNLYLRSAGTLHLYASLAGFRSIVDKRFRRDRVSALRHAQPPGRSGIIAGIHALVHIGLHRIGSAVRDCNASARRRLKRRPASQAH